MKTLHSFFAVAAFALALSACSDESALVKADFEEASLKSSTQDVSSVSPMSQETLSALAKGGKSKKNSDKSSKSDKSEKTGKSEKSDKSGKSGKSEKGSKIEVCHVDQSTSEVKLISVGSTNAFDKHLLNHAGDGVPGTGYTAICQPDADSDGVADTNDAFPNDPSESADSDGDGVGDNGDAFPNDPSESADSDGDGVGDHGDAFPNDPSESADSDGDGMGDNSDPFPNDPTNGAGNGPSCQWFSEADIPATVNEMKIWDSSGTLTSYTGINEVPIGPIFYQVSRPNFPFPNFTYLTAYAFQRTNSGWGSFAPNIQLTAPSPVSQGQLDGFVEQVCGQMEQYFNQYQDATVEEEGEFDEEEG